MNKIILSKIDEILNEETVKGLTRISKKYNIDLNDLLNTWNSDKHTPAAPAVKKFQVKKSAANSVAESASGTDDDDEPSQKSGKCVYKFIKGKNEGNFCDCSVKLNSKYCSKHIKYEEKGQKPKTSLPKNKVVDKKNIQKPIRLNEEIGKFWHKESQLVFKSSSEKVVIGSYRDKVLRKLTDEDVETCKQFGFKFKLEDDDFNKELEESNKSDDKSPEEEKIQKELEKKRIEDEKKQKIEEEKKKLDEEKKQKEIEDKKASEAKRLKELERKKLEEVKKRNELEKNKQSLEKVKQIEKKNKKTISECVADTNNCAKNVEDVLEDMFLGSEEEREENVENEIDSENEEFAEFEDEEDVLDEETFEEED